MGVGDEIISENVGAGCSFGDDNYIQLSPNYYGECRNSRVVPVAPSDLYNSNRSGYAVREMKNTNLSNDTCAATPQQDVGIGVYYEDSAPSEIHTANTPCWKWIPGASDERIGQRLITHIAAWKDIKCDRVVNQGVMPQWVDEKMGKEKLSRERRPFPVCGPVKLLSEYQKLLNDELREGIVVPVPDDYVKCWNPTFVVPKKNGEYRKVLNCRRLNALMKDIHFKMEDVRAVKDVILQGDYAVSIDITSAYNHVSVHPSLRPFLCFQFEGISYSYCGMPFGYKDAPRIFTRIMRCVIWNVRRIWGIRCVQYLDDLLFLDQNPAELQRIMR
jgi:hypothetical protein